MVQSWKMMRRYLHDNKLSLKVELKTTMKCYTCNGTNEGGTEKAH